MYHANTLRMWKGNSAHHYKQYVNAGVESILTPLYICCIASKVEIMWPSFIICPIFVKNLQNEKVTTSTTKQVSSVNHLWIYFIFIRLSGDIKLNPPPKHNSKRSFSICHLNLNSKSVHNYIKITLLRAYVSVKIFICYAFLELNSICLHYLMMVIQKCPAKF